MAKETKIGLVIIGLLTAGLGTALYQRIHDTDAADPMTASTANSNDTTPTGLLVDAQAADTRPTLVVAETTSTWAGPREAAHSGWTGSTDPAEPAVVTVPETRIALMPAVEESAPITHSTPIAVTPNPITSSTEVASAHTVAEREGPELNARYASRLPEEAPHQQPTYQQPTYQEHATEPSLPGPSEPSRYRNDPQPYRPAQYQQADPNDSMALPMDGYDMRVDRSVQAVSGGEYVVRPNDNFWTISKALYGSGDYFKALTRYNDQRHPLPDRLAVGDKVLAPSKTELLERFPQLCPKQRAAGSSIAPVSAKPLQAGRLYEVKEGDTLFDIARYELGEGSRWVEIYQLNQQLLTEDFNYVKPGMKLRLPGRPKRTGQPADRVTRQPAPRRL